MSRNARLLIALFAVFALVLAACGSDDDDTTTEGDESTETTEAEGDAAETTEAMEDEDGETTEAMEDEGDGEAMVDAECPSESGTLNVGTKFDQPLFGVNTPDGVVGFDAEVANYVAEQLGCTSVEFQEAVSANREPFLENGTVDMVVATYTINDARDEIIDFAGPYYQAGQDIMVAAGNPLGITGIDDLNSGDVRSCSVEGSTSLDNLNELAPDADVTTFDAYSKCADALGQGRVDAVTTDNVILLGLVDESDGAYELIENPFTEEPYGIGVPEGSPARCQINAILQTMYDDGTWASLYEATVGAVASQTPTPPAINNEGC
ncbi:MAG: glutamate ABC transporter substrate-binding protein [Acidimicrobiales bacterium]